jgi:hypothetical protein
MKCGREPNGAKISEQGICRATTDTSANGLNGGKNGGRICWAIVGTIFGDDREICARNRFTCFTCKFFELVEKEEGVFNFEILKPGQILI